MEEEGAEGMMVLAEDAGDIRLKAGNCLTPGESVGSREGRRKGRVDR